MSFNRKELKRVERANSRPGRVDYDLAYSTQTEKFRVSPDIFEEMNMDEHGLTLYERQAQSQLVLAAEPNEEAVMHRGKEGFKKGREFKATRMRTKLDRYGMSGVNRFGLDFWHEEEGIRYYIIRAERSAEPEKSAEAPDTQPIDYVPTGGEDPESVSPPEPAPQTSDKPDPEKQPEPELPDDEPEPDPPYGDVGAPPEPEEEKKENNNDDPDFDDLDSLLQ